MTDMQGGYKSGVGRYGEDIASRYLENLGFSIVERNFRSGRLGEIDIISRENEYICFGEVKTRSGTAYGFPSESVGYRKRNGIKRLAQLYLKSKGMHDSCVRFDVIEVFIKRNGELIEPVSVNLIRNAF